MGFLLGLLVGIVATPIIMAVVAKPLTKWFLKRKLKGFVGDVSSDVQRKIDRFKGAIPEQKKYGKEDSKKRRE